MKRSIRAVTVGSGTEPSSSTASWNARMLNIETRSLPNLLVATLATLPSMSLIPSAPFAPSVFSTFSTDALSRETVRSAGARVPATARRDARLCLVPFLIESPNVSRMPPASLDRYPRGHTGHVAHPLLLHSKFPRAIWHKNPARQMWLPKRRKVEASRRPSA